MTKRLNEKGQEVLSGKPVAVPAKIRKISEVDKFRQVVAGMLSDHASSRDVESFEEANDFIIDEDPFPQSRYELTPAEEVAFNEFVHRSVEAQKGKPVVTDRHLPEGLSLRHSAPSSDSGPDAGSNPAPVQSPPQMASEAE